MLIKFTPQRRDVGLAVSVAGDTIGVNGQAFDLSQLQEGETLPSGAVASSLFSGEVRRIGGVLHVSLALPYGINPQIDPMQVVEVEASQGHVAVPGHDAEQPAEITLGAIDWARVESPLPLSDKKAAAILEIDADVDAITAAVVGNRGVEYVEAEAQALTYQQAGYTGTVPSMAQAWVNAKAIEGIDWTAQQAAEDILATAAAWRGAVDLIRSNRLAAKAYVRVAADESDLALAMGTWAGFVAAIRSQLEI